MDALIEAGWWVKGVTAGRGVVVACPRYVAFIPTERPKHLGAELAWGVAGFIEVGATKLSPGAIIKELGRGSLDTQVDEIIPRLHGRRWLPATVRVKRKKALFRKSRGLWFQQDPESIRFARMFAADEVERAQAMLATWTWEP